MGIPSSPEVRTGSLGSIPGPGTKILQAKRNSQNTRKQTKSQVTLKIWEFAHQVSDYSEKSQKYMLGDMEGVA